MIQNITQSFRSINAKDSNGFIRRSRDSVKRAFERKKFVEIAEKQRKLLTLMMGKDSERTKYNNSIKPANTLTLAIKI